MNLLKLEEFVKKSKECGIARKIDELGRIVIPYRFRKDIFQGVETVYLQRIGEYIILRKNDEDNTAIKKKLDELGRLVINIEIRKELKWHERDSITIYAFDDFIVMKK